MILIDILSLQKNAENTEWMSGFNRILCLCWLRYSIFIFSFDAEMVGFADNKISHSVEMSGDIITHL